VTSVAISSDGHHVVVGIASNSLVLHYAWTGSQWTRRQPDVPGSGGEMFGSSVALSSEGYRIHLVVGAPQDSNAPRSGSMKIFELVPCVG
jgi:FG-GAP repeat